MDFHQPQTITTGKVSSSEDGLAEVEGGRRKAGRLPWSEDWQGTKGWPG